MQSRYFVTYKYSTGAKTETSTQALGRCWDMEFAEQRARDRYKSPEFEIIEVRRETEFEAAAYKMFRIFVRSLRIFISVAIGLFAISFLNSNESNISEIPLSELTLGMIFASLFNIAIIFIAIWLCWEIAFGDGPQDDR